MRSQLKLQLSALVLMMAFTAPAAAQSKKKSAAPTPAPAEAAPVNPDKVDVTDIENKYWASKDTDFSVVQNRLYPKAKRFAVSASTGPIVSDPNSEGFFHTLDASYYFDERKGVAFTYQMANLEDNENVDALFQSRGARIDHNKAEQFIGASFLWVPIYAKASFLNTKIFYFDFALAPGVGVITYEQQIEAGNKKKTAPALALDVSQQFFFSNHFAVRFDYRHRFYQHNRVNWRPTASSPAYDKKQFQHDQILTFGATFFF